MAEFIIRTNDSVYTYDVSESSGDKTAEITFESENNNKSSETQGFLHKIQVGRFRVRAKVSILDSKTRLEANILPMLTYPDTVVVTFDRNIPNHSSATGNFTFDKYDINKEFDEGTLQETIIQLTEVLTT